MLLCIKYKYIRFYVRLTNPSILSIFVGGKICKKEQIGKPTTYLLYNINYYYVPTAYSILQISHTTIFD